jgi:hypothetical protein
MERPLSEKLSSVIRLTATEDNKARPIGAENIMQVL